MPRGAVASPCPPIPESKACSAEGKATRRVYSWPGLRCHTAQVNAVAKLTQPRYGAKHHAATGLLTHGAGRNRHRALITAVTSMAAGVIWVAGRSARPAARLENARLWTR